MSRKLSFNERLYQIGEDLSPPFSLFFLLEGKGSLSFDELRVAVYRLREAMPVLSMETRNYHWHFDGEGPLVQDMKGETFDWDHWIFHLPPPTREVACIQFYWFAHPGVSIGEPRGCPDRVSIWCQWDLFW